ncbi:ribosomal protein S21 [Rhizobium sp. BK619]|nr:ribosomal protein S21 [Rhizobium sp. BK619]
MMKLRPRRPDRDRTGASVIFPPAFHMHLDFLYPICYPASPIARLRPRERYIFAPGAAPPPASTNQRNVILVQVLVRDNNVDQALRALKKKMQREGIFREMKMRDYYEKPSQKRAREKAEAVRRVRKLARKRAQREGLVAR